MSGSQVDPHPAMKSDAKRGEEEIAEALAPFGWTCGFDFWQRYYSDAWVFNLANAVVAAQVAWSTYE